MGHWISFCITLPLLLALLIFILRQATSGHRKYIKRPLTRWGPTVLLAFALPLILADLIRHIVQDYGGWGECGNNDLYPRINSTDPYPASCAWASNQYICENTCCVPAWDNTTKDWGSPQSLYFPSGDATVDAQFAVSLSSSPSAADDLQFPAGFDFSEQPWRIFTYPLVLDGTGMINIAEGGKNKYPRGDCKYGVNPDTGYCWLTDQNLSYEEQLLQLNGQSCDCDSCLPNSHESIGHLSNVGIVFTIVFTYTGFILLAIAVMWNADIVTKFKKIQVQWHELRARARARG
jgi:hypothetical protein